MEHYNFIQVLRPLRKYDFDIACVYFTKDVDNDSFIKCLLQLPTIQYEGTYNLKKMVVDQMLAHVTQLHEAQQKKKTREKKSCCYCYCLHPS